MPSTPFTARCTSHTPNAADLARQKAQTWEWLSSQRTDAEFYFMPFLEGGDLNVMKRIKERKKNIIESMMRKEPSRQELWDLGMTLYMIFARNIINQFSKLFKNISVTNLLDDGQFHRCLVLCAFESLRFLLIVCI